MVDRIVPRGAPGAPRLSVSKCRGALAWTHACSPAPAGRVCTVERATSAPAPVGPVRRESMTAWRVRAHHYLAARAPAAPAAPEQRARTRDAARLSSGSSAAPASSAARASAAAVRAGGIQACAQVCGLRSHPVRQRRHSAHLRRPIIGSVQCNLRTWGAQAQCQQMQGCAGLDACMQPSPCRASVHSQARDLSPGTCRTRAS